MHSLVKNVFLTLAGVMAALAFYVLFFGTQSFEGDTIELPDAIGYDNTSIANTTWKGVLWYVAEYMEKPVAKYYYDYCYVPNIHQSDYVDEALGLTLKKPGLWDTTAILTGDNDVIQDKPAEEGVYWSTGWR